MKSIDLAIQKAGGVARLARTLGVGASVVSNWKSTGSTPAKRVLAVEAATGVSRHELRPDVFGPPPPNKEEAA